MKKLKAFYQNNGLSIVLLFLMLFFIAGQYYAGYKEYNKEREEYHLPDINLAHYITTGHFQEALFENWESEFLQMSMYVLLTVYLRQRGSAESKKFEGKEDVDRQPRPASDAPWPVRKGGLWLKLYKNSLSLAFGVLFILSFVIHLFGSLREYNFQQYLKHEAPETGIQFLGNSKLWFESFQNWQSEFLAVALLVLFTIWFRQYGSPQSKPVDAPYDETGK